MLFMYSFCLEIFKNPGSTSQPHTMTDQTLLWGKGQVTLKFFVYAKSAAVFFFVQMSPNHPSPTPVHFTWDVGVWNETKWYTLIVPVGSDKTVTVNLHAKLSWDRVEQVCLLQIWYAKCCEEYFFFLFSNLQEGIWGGERIENGARTLVTARVQPGYVICTSQGRLPGCLFKFDDPQAQCRDGRRGSLN